MVILDILSKHHTLHKSIFYFTEEILIQDPILKQKINKKMVE